MNPQSTLDEEFSLALPCVRVRQPIGEFYVAAIDSAMLIQITYADVRRMYGDREVDTYLGIQREVSKKRVREIGDYVNTVDACFPTSVILAVEGRCAEYIAEERLLVLKTDLCSEKPDDRVHKLQIAKVLDGQHRIEGLRALESGHGEFQVNVSVFVDMDIENQAYLFSMVNLAQTKVSKSLAYDLFEYAKARSPQKTAHNIAVALDALSSSPFYARIKRLGVATSGRFTETLTQATFVEALLRYISTDPVSDRDLYLRERTPALVSAIEARKLIFRNMFIAGQDHSIADVVLNYFSAVRRRWERAWDRRGDGYMLNKTNGFRALMRFLQKAYLQVAVPGDIPTEEAFLQIFERSELRDDDFTIDRFKPGTSGETALFRALDELLPNL